MSAKAGDRVVAESERAAKHCRTGVIEQVLDEVRPRYRVKWDDGGTSVVSPEAGAVRVEPRTTSARKT